MIRRINDYSYIDDNAFEKIANVINDQKKLINIVEDEDHAQVIAKNMQNEYDTKIEKNNNHYYIYAMPKQQVALDEAKSSGFFQKIAYNQYQFNKQANNSLGWQHYNFDDGTIWKVMTANDGKEYLVKEVDDKNNQIIRQPCEKINTNLVITANKHIANSQIKRLCNILYGDIDPEFINDLSKSFDLFKMLINKLDLVINSELDYLNIQSNQYKQNIYDKIMQGIKNNTITNRKQISNLIKGGNFVE